MGCTVNSELYSVLCMHCWLAGWLARLVLHCMNFELWPRPGYKPTKYHSMSHALLQIIIFPFSHTAWVQSDKEKSSVTIALAFAFLWARCGQVRAEQPHLGECVASPDWNLATQPWHRVGYSGSKHFQILFAGPWDQTTATLCRTHKLCRGRACLEYLCRQPQQTLIFPVMRYSSLYNTSWMIRLSYEAFYHSSSPFHHSIPPFHSIERRHPNYRNLPVNQTQPASDWRNWEGLSRVKWCKIVIEVTN